ncbi:unnamed protein product [Haemonchus placei]|uniref:Uncharacterized protein n=1 Tax=Haemonchus placei TaxID=6290 RepID=A0A0N4XC24_HAEPC|nr:unnamed protein product [Haemonchus placei]
MCRGSGPARIIDSYHASTRNSVELPPVYQHDGHRDAASSQTESSDVESLSSDSSRRNTMSSSGGDRDAAHSRCKNNPVVEREIARDMSQSYSLTSQVDYGSDECAVRTPDDTYPCCSSSEAVGGGASEGYTSVSGAASQTESSSGNGDGLLNVLSVGSHFFLTNSNYF